ncbi:MAG: PKD repeat protein [Desulforhopalus sp.]|jgi:PKD repeat protein
MKTVKKSNMYKSVKMVATFLCLVGVATYAISDGVSTASESREQSLLSTFTEKEAAAHFEGKVPFKITFDSKQFVGPMESYTWNFGDGEMAQGAVISHTFLSAGTYSVILTAKHNTGQIHQEQVTVSVAPKQ